MKLNKCTICPKNIPRIMRAAGCLEPPSQYSRKRYCSHECRQIASDRRVKELKKKYKLEAKEREKAKSSLSDAINQFIYR